jgi:beta-barrel assembly-enhancing protease
MARVVSEPAGTSSDGLMKMLNTIRRCKAFRLAVTLTVLTLMIWLGAGPGALAWAFGLSEEKALGRKILGQIREHFPLVEDGELVGYVQSVGNRIAKGFDSSLYQYQLFIINSPVPNAFAIPGGYIFIYRGIIDMMDNEGELAGIISHEMAHIQARHIAHRIEDSRILNIATIAGVLAAVFLGGGGNASAAMAVGALAGAQTLQLQYSRENEEEADRYGFSYFCAAGYDPRDMVAVMQNISRARFQPDSRMPSYLSSHPLLGERIHYLQMMAEKDRKSSDKSLQRQPQGDFLLMKAALISEYEDPHVARERLQSMARQKDLEMAATYGLGRLDLRQNQAEQALEKFRQLAAQRPNSSMILSSMGAAYFQQGRLDEARKVLSTALVLDSNAVNIHYRLAMVLRDMGQTEEALQHLRKAEQMAPVMPEIDYQLGVLLGQKNDLGMAHYYLGSYYRQRKDVKPAIFHYEKAKNLLAASSARKAEVEEALRELKGEKARKDQEKTEKDKIRKPMPYGPVLGPLPGAASSP